MSLWLLMTILCSAAAVGVSIPLIRHFENEDAGSLDKAVYEDQLKEVEKDLQNGGINAPEAEAAKIEIQRRLAMSGKNVVAARPISMAWRNVALIATSGTVILGSVILYSLMGSPNLPSSDAQPGAATQPETAASASTPGQIDDMIAKLTARLQTHPEDAEGWRMLGWSQFSLQHYAESADAYAKAVALDPANTDYKSAYAEALVQMTQGIVAPKAQALFAEVLAKQPKDSRARFYDALSHEQSGDQSGALDRWLTLLADTPPDAGWRDEVRQRITDLGKAIGRDVSGALAASGGASQTLSQPDKDAMIAGMVAKLAARLQENPNDVEGWVRLMRSYQVLNEPAKAKEALTTALATFASDAATTSKLNATAAELGIK